eukprot:6417732-Amphidinium_carterae.1
MVSSKVSNELGKQYGIACTSQRPPQNKSTNFVKSPLVALICWLSLSHGLRHLLSLEAWQGYICGRSRRHDCCHLEGSRGIRDLTVAAESPRLPTPPCHVERAHFLSCAAHAQVAPEDHE